MTKMYESENKQRALNVLGTFRFAFSGISFLVANGTTWEVWAVPPPSA